jgi:hypothetical protein
LAAAKPDSIPVMFVIGHKMPALIKGAGIFLCPISYCGAAVPFPGFPGKYRLINKSNFHHFIYDVCKGEIL